jgi:hypothetical protein
VALSCRLQGSLCNITLTVESAAGVLLGNKMSSASVDTGGVTFLTTPISLDPGSKDRTIPAQLVVRG